jgi:hypothetical protein
MPIKLSNRGDGIGLTGWTEAAAESVRRDRTPN